MIFPPADLKQKLQKGGYHFDSVAGKPAGASVSRDLSAVARPEPPGAVFPPRTGRENEDPVLRWDFGSHTLFV